MPEPDEISDLELLESAVREAGNIARRHFGGTFKHWDKAGTPVTEADLEIDAFLRRRLCDARPGYGWMSEETTDDPARLDAERVFVIDPIDGTIAFVKAKPHFTICAAIVHGDAAIAGAIYNPILDEFFCARANGGAFCNGRQIHVSARTELEGCRMMGVKAMFEHPFWSSLPNTPWPAMHVESRNSVAYRMALVASGAFDAVVALSNKRDWDLAAGDIILREAGGRLSAHDGTPLRYNGPDAMQRSLIAAGPALYEQILHRVGNVSLP